MEAESHMTPLRRWLNAAVLTFDKRTLSMDSGHERRHDAGSAMVISVLMLAILTVIGFSAATLAFIEVRISGNEKQYKQGFYQAEGAALLAAQIVEETQPLNLRGDNDNRQYTYNSEDVSFPKRDALPNPDNMLDDANWTTGVSDAPEDLGECASNPPDFLVVETKGGTLDPSKPSRVHEYELYGRFRKTDSQGNPIRNMVIAVGFRKRVSQH